MRLANDRVLWMMSALTFVRISPDVSSHVARCNYTSEGSTMNLSPEGRPKQRSPSSPSLQQPRLAIASSNFNGIERTPTDSVNVLRAEFPPAPEVIIRTGTGLVQRQVETSRPPRPATTSCEVKPRNVPVDSTPTGMPKSCQRSPAREFKAYPNNPSCTTDIGRGVPGDLGCQRAPSVLVGEAEEGVPEDGAGDERSWPGSDFKLEQVLEGSVYLWACGEHGSEGAGGTASCVPRCEAAAAWVVLVVSWSWRDDVSTP